MNQIKYRSSVVINIFAVSLLATFRLTPIVHRLYGAVYFLALFFFWLISLTQLPKRIEYKGIKPMISAWVLLWVIQFIYRIIGISTIDYPNLIISLTTYLIPVIFATICTSYNKREIKSLLIILFLIVFANIVHNEILFVQNPFRFSMLLDDESTYKTTNIGRTEFVAMSLFFVAYCWILIKGGNEKRFRPFLLLGIVLSFILITVVNSRGTDFFLGLLMMVAFIILPKLYLGKKTSRHFFLVFFSAIFIIAFLNYDTLVESVVNLFGNSDNGRMMRRVIDVNDLLHGGADEVGQGSLATRITLYKLSLNTFLSNPITFLFGKGDIIQNADDVSVIMKSGIGCHSEFLDTLARFGLLGAILYFNVLSTTYSYVKNLPIKKQGQQFWKISFAFFLLYSVVNGSFLPEIFFVIFLFIPLAVFYCYHIEQE